MRKSACTVGVMVMLVGATLAASPQTSAPPIKMGLWQTTSTSTITGFQLPPEVEARLKAMGKQLPFGQPHTAVVQSCITKEKWEHMFSDMQKNRDCHFTNLHQSATGMSADMTCKSDNGKQSSQGHIEATYDSAEKIHGKAHIESTGAAQAKPIVMDMRYESVYQGSDCHGIAPGEGKLVR